MESTPKNIISFKRLPIYGKTDLEVDASLSPDEIADKILSKSYF